MLVCTHNMHTHVRTRIHKIITQEFFHTADEPEIPQDNILVEQRRDDNTINTCNLHISWNSPVNYNLEYLSRYMINLDGENIVNKTDNLNASLNFFTLSLDCGTYRVSIKAIDICDRVSNNTPAVMVTPDKVPFSLSTSGPTATTGGPPECSAQGISYSILISKSLVTFKICYPDTLVSIILGAFLGLFGIIIAVLATELWRSKHKRTCQPNQVSDGLSCSCCTVHYHDLFFHYYRKSLILNLKNKIECRVELYICTPTLL